MTKTLRERLAQPEPPCKTGSQCIGGKCPQCVVDEPEPVAYRCPDWSGRRDYTYWEPDERPSTSKGVPAGEPLYTAPPQREWQGLTDEDMQGCIKTADYRQGQYKRTPYWAHLASAIEAKLREKNA